jgi:hypothetical protein
MKTIAFGGDVCQKLGWQNPPLTNFRYFNNTTHEVRDLEPLRQVVGSLPFEITQGIDLAVQWLKEHNN